MPGALADVFKIIAERGDVADLAPGPDLLAVELDPEPAVPGEAVQQRGRQILTAPPSTLVITVHGARALGSPSGRSSTARRWFSNCEVWAPSMLQCPVLCGRMASSLTTTEPSARCISSTASTPTTPSSWAMVSASCWRRGRLLVGQPGRRGDRLHADPVALHGFRDRVGGRLARRRPHDERAQLAGEVDELLGDDLDPGRQTG